MVRSFLAGTCMTLLFAPAMAAGASARANTPDSTHVLARALAREILIIDTHVDLPGRLQDTWENISQKTRKGDFDYPRARKGGLGVAFAAAYVPASLEGTGRAKRDADVQIDLVEKIVARWPDKFGLVHSPREVQEKAGKGRVLFALAVENGSALENDLHNIEYFARRGVQYITLVHAKCNGITDASYDTARQWQGLSPFGKQVVAEMNRLGIMIDVSHLSDSGFYDVLRCSKVPVIASHSSCRAFTPGWERNMDDAMIKAIGDAGGVMQINFGSSFIREDIHRAMEEESKAFAAFLAAAKVGKGSPKARAFLRRYRQKHPKRYADVSDVARHIDHAVHIAGIDHVGIGSDFDGLGDELPEGLKDVSMYPNLLAELLKLGYSRDDITKIFSGNFLRVWSAVKEAARANEGPQP